MLDRFNKIIRKICIPLNIINVLVGLILGIAYVYIPLATIGGLILGTLMAISGSTSIAISYYFTNRHSKPVDNKKPIRRHTSKSTAFLCAAIPMIFLNSGASFFGMYTGILLLTSALAFPIAPAIITITAIVLGSILAAGTLINSWLQTHSIWESLKLTVKPTQQSRKQVVASHHPYDVCSQRKQTAISHAKKVGTQHHANPDVNKLFKRKYSKLRPKAASRQVDVTAVRFRLS